MNKEILRRRREKKKGRKKINLESKALNLFLPSKNNVSHFCTCVVWGKLGWIPTGGLRNIP